MDPSGEQSPEQPVPPQLAGESVRLEAHASGQARIHQAARDLHLHYQDGVRGTRRVEPGTRAGECPYPGLASFGREQAPWFFGRDQLTAKLTARLDERLRTGGVQVVVAPSGAGKSSLLHAGLLSQLAHGALPGSSQWPVIVFTPTAHPLTALATHIAARTDADPAVLVEKLTADSRSAGRVLSQALRRCVGAANPEARVVVVVDQFEELFTLCTNDQHRRTFIELLTQLASPRSGDEEQRAVGVVVVGVRADFYAACANDAHLRTALEDNPLVIGPMSEAELREAILYPAQNVGLDVEPGLVELLLRDLGDTATTPGGSGMTGYEAGRLPLLAHALRATWQQRHGHTLTVEGYRSTGGIHHAVATTAEQVFTGLDPAGQQAARALFLRLIKIGDGTEDTRRRLARTDLLRGLDSGNVGSVIDAFTQGRLLTQEQDAVEITHEALVRAWPRLRQWIDTDRGGNLIRQDLEDAAAVWDRDRRDTAGLYRGSRLEAARTWAVSTLNEGDPSPTVSEFLAASTAQQHRASRLRRTVLVVLSVLALVASGAAVVALQQRVTAQRERETVTLNQITAQADLLRDKDVSLAAQLDLTAYRMWPTPDRYTALVTLGNAALSTSLAGYTDRVTTVAFSPDGRTLATGSDDHTVRLWSMADPAHPTSLGPPLSGHTDHVRSVVFSLDGRTLATGSADRTVRLWNVTDPAHPTSLSLPLTGHTDEVNAITFSPDERTLATASYDHTVRLWNVTDPAHPTALGPPLTGHTNYVNTVAFSPDGHTLATGGNDETVRLWNVTDPAHPIPLGPPLSYRTPWINAVVFSPDGRTLASGDGETVRLWNVTDPAHPTALGPPLTGHIDDINAMVFSPDGHILASGSGDQTVRLWDVIDPAHPTALGPPLTGHTNVVSSVAFSPDGYTLASGSYDRTVRLWDIPRTFLTSHTAHVTAAAFSPNGRTLATGSDDQMVRLWNVTDPAHPTPLGPPLTGHTTWVHAVVFSPDERTLASGDGETVRLWNVTDPAHPTALGPPLTGHTDDITAMAFSPDGHTLASGSNDHTVRLWNVTNLAHPTSLGPPLTGHTNWVKSVAFSPDGLTLATGSADHTMRLWNVTNPAHPTSLSPPLTGHRDLVNAVAFSPDGRTLASGSDDHTVRLWNVTALTHPIPLGPPLTGHTSYVNAVVFSPDGRTLASGGYDSTVRLWNVADPAHPTSLGQPLTGHTYSVVRVAFSPDGHTLATGSEDDTIRLWEMNVDQVMQRICATTRNTLTLAKWEQYVSPDLPYRPPCP